MSLNYVQVFKKIVYKDIAHKKTSGWRSATSLTLYPMTGSLLWYKFSSRENFILEIMTVNATYWTPKKNPIFIHSGI